MVPAKPEDVRDAVGAALEAADMQRCWPRNSEQTRYTQKPKTLIDDAVTKIEAHVLANRDSTDVVDVPADGIPPTTEINVTAAAEEIRKPSRGTDKEN